jgi:O-antigen ligase
MMHLDIATLGLAGVLSIILLWFTFKSTETWLIVGILSHLILFIHGRGDETSLPAAIAYSVIFYPGLFFWFGKKILARERIIHGWEEFALILFMIFAFMSIGWASMYGFSSVKGIREFALFIPYLMYFPIRDHVSVKSEEGIIVALLVVCFFSAVWGVVRYHSLLEVAQYFWQVGGNRIRSNAPLFMAAVIILLAFLAARKYNLLLVLVAISLNAVAEGFTFARGYWAATALGVGLLILTMRGKARRRVLTFSALSLLAVVLTLLVMFPELFSRVILGFGVRLEQTGFADVSLQSRLAESESVLRYIARSPLIGYGLGSEFSFFNPLGYITSVSWYIHNGYLFLLFKFGIVGAALFMAFYSAMFVRTVRMARTSEGLTKSLLLAFVSIMGVMLIVNITSPQFYDRGSLLILTVMWGIAAGVMEKQKIEGRIRAGN